MTALTPLTPLTPTLTSLPHDLLWEIAYRADRESMLCVLLAVPPLVDHHIELVRAKLSMDDMWSCNPALLHRFMLLLGVRSRTVPQRDTVLPQHDAVAPQADGAIAANLREHVEHFLYLGEATSRFAMLFNAAVRFEHLHDVCFRVLVSRHLNEQEVDIFMAHLTPTKQRTYLYRMLEVFKPEKRRSGRQAEYVRYLQQVHHIPSALLQWCEYVLSPLEVFHLSFQRQTGSLQRARYMYLEDPTIVDRYFAAYPLSNAERKDVIKHLKVRR